VGGLKEMNIPSSDSYLEYEAVYVNSTRTQGFLVWYNSDGKEMARFKATSGSGSPKYFTLPEGDYVGSNFNTSSNTLFMRDGIGFTVRLGPSKVWDTNKKAYRIGLLIHPARYSGTQGCIGLIDNSKQILNFRYLISSYLQINRSINVAATVKK